jgi:hypothetical protein
MLDVLGQGLPTLASTIQTTAPQLIGALPIPSAAIVGVVLGWIMSAFLLFLAIITNLSRKKFGAAFVTSMALIPVVGASIMNAAKSLERIAGKISDRRDRLVKSVRSVFGPAVGDTVTQYIPDLNEPEGVDEPIPSIGIPSLGIPSLDAAKGMLPGVPSLDSAKMLPKVPSLNAAKMLPKNMLTRKPAI